MEQGTGCGCGLDRARPFSRETAPGLDSGKSLRIRRRGPVDSKKKTAIVFTIEAHRWNPSYEKAIALEVAIMRITQIDGVSRLVHHTFCAGRNKTSFLQEGPLRGIDYCSVTTEKTISYQYIFSFCYNMCPLYAWMWTPFRFLAAYHTTLKVSGIYPGVKSSCVGGF